MHIGPGEIALLIVLALVLFGAKKLPQVGRAAGEAIREFKSAFEGKSPGNVNIASNVNIADGVEAGAAKDSGGGGEGNGNQAG